MRTPSLRRSRRSSGSFREIGTFATFTDKVTAERPGNFGGGIIGGHATLDGRPVTLAVDDDSLVQPAARSTGKAARLYQMARQRRNPYIEIAQDATVPDLGPRPGKTGTDSARTFGAEPAFPGLLERGRAIPVVAAVLGDTSGASSFTAGLCDFLVRLEGTRNIVTGLGRMAGIPVGVLANAPMRMAGGLTPECCLKAVSFVCLCDAFGVPLLVLQDTPGFLVSAAAERDRAVARVMTLLQAMSLVTVPTVSVVIRKAFGLAFVRRHPYVGLSSGTGGLARGGPRNLGVLDPIWGMSGGPMLLEMCRRDRVVPVVSAVVRHSFGDSSFFTGLSDFVIQLRGTSMALTGPRVLAIGTSERVTVEELGGVDVHRHNGQADVIAETLDDVYESIRRILSFLPSCAGAPMPVRDPGAPAGLMNPAQPIRRLIDGLCDARSFLTGITTDPLVSDLDRPFWHSRCICVSEFLGEQGGSTRRL